MLLRDFIILNQAELDDIFKETEEAFKQYVRAIWEWDWGIYVMKCHNQKLSDKK